MNTLTGTRRLTRLALQRDWINLSAWIVGLSAFTGATAALWIDSFRGPADLLQEAQLTATNPGIRMLGLASGPTVGGYTMVRDYVLLAVLAALMSTFAVVRNTRQNEETGRAELVGAAVVGRHAGLVAALIVTVGANAVLAGALGLAMTLAGLPAAGAFTAGIAVAAVGVAFAGVAAVTTQLSSTTRGASGLAAAVLAVAFLASGISNMAGNTDASGTSVTSAWPTWLSPIGWGQQMRPFNGDRWWLIGLTAILFLACAAAAAVLTNQRDIGRGVLVQHGGPANAGLSLRSPVGLVWRLQRGTLLGWAVGMLAFGLVMGGMIGQVQDMTGAAREWYTRMGGSEQFLDAYRASLMQMAGIAAAIYVVQVLLRMRAEESDGTLEPLLATAISRPRWVASHALNALFGATALLVLFGVGAGLASGAVLGNPVGESRTLIGAGLVQLAGVLVVGALVIAAVALLPRFAGAVSWALLMAFILLGPLFGNTLQAPQWAKDLSPFSHVPKVPAVPIEAGPVVGLAAVVIASATVGVVMLRRRDLALPA